MHRAGRKKSRESSQAPSSSTRRREPEPRQAYNEDYGKKVVYVSLGGRSEFESWAMIDPNYEKYGQVESDKIIFQPVEDTEKLPDLCEVLGCGYVNYESKIYVIGGLAKGPGEVGPRVKSNRVFIYDLISKSWEESPSRLNICRRSPQVFVAGKVIYVVGGLSNDDHYPSRKTYVEFYDFDSVPQRWELLYTSVPNKALSPGRYPFSGALYERCNQFLMCTPRFGIFAFDYVKRTWIDMRSHHHLTDYFSDCLAQVIIVDDILFGASFSTIIAYHLKKKKILSEYSLEQDPYLRLVREPTLRLFCVNNDTLLLMCCLDQYTLEPSKKIYCCRYRIDYSSEETCGIRLVRDGSQIFQAKGDFIGPFLLVKQDIATMNMTDSGKHHTEVLNWSDINISQRSTVLQQPPTENKRRMESHQQAKRPIPPLEYTPRPGHCISGDILAVCSNHFLVQVPNSSFHVYDVAITPKVTSNKVNKDVFRALIHMFDEYGVVYHDRRSIYTTRPFSFTSNEFLINLLGKGSQDETNSYRREREFKVVINFVGKTDPHDQLQFLLRRQKEIPIETIRVLDAVLRKTTFNSLGRDLGDGSDFIRGIYQSLISTQMGLSLNIGVSTRSVYKDALNEKQVGQTYHRHGEREDRIKSIINDDIYLQNHISIHVMENPTVINARVLPAPRLMYHDTGIEKYVEPVAGQWSMINKKMINSGCVLNWACISFSLIQSSVVVDRFLEELSHTCRSNGLSIHTPIDSSYCCDPNEMNRVLLKLQSSALQLLVIILPDDDRGFYGKIKFVCETKLGIVTQCCQPLKVLKCETNYLHNLSLKINVKVGGRNNVLFDAMCRRITNVSDMPTIIFGAELAHSGTKHGSRPPSIAAVVASMDWPELTNYRALVSAQPPCSEMIDDLYSVTERAGSGGMIRDHLLAFERSTGHKPSKIIFYRAGLSEDQFSKVLKSEMTAIRQACMSLEDNYLPRVTYVVAKKRHHTRLFTHQIGDVPPGTVVDTKICHPTRFDFYLSSHAGNQRMSRPAHYHVLYDENLFEVDELYTLTYNLCYTYARCTRSVSIVPPILYAHLAASRARLYLKNVDNEKIGKEPLLPEVKENVTAVMFYC